MAHVEEMEGKPREVPGLKKTIESVISIVRQSREEGGAPRSTLDAQELMELFKSDLQPQAPARDRAAAVSPEEKETQELARIRKALYSV